MNKADYQIIGLCLQKLAAAKKPAPKVPATPEEMLSKKPKVKAMYQKVINKIPKIEMEGKTTIPDRYNFSSINRAPDFGPWQTTPIALKDFEQQHPKVVAANPQWAEDLKTIKEMADIRKAGGDAALAEYTGGEEPVQMLQNTQNVDDVERWSAAQLFNRNNATTAAGVAEAYNPGDKTRYTQKVIRVIKGLSPTPKKR